MRASPKQLALAHWWHRPATRDMDGVIAEGAVRSGKTYAMVTGFLTWSRSEFHGGAFIVAGRSVGALKRNVVRPMLEVMRRMGWSYEYNRSEQRIDCGGNAYYLFGASNEAAQDVLQGLTACGAYADEAALFPEGFIDQMAARCSVEGSKLWFNCNPRHPSHFFKTRWIDRAEELNLLHLRFEMRDNPSLSERTIERYERMYTGVFYKRYILGLWTLAEGLVYPDYEQAFEPTYEGRAARWAVSCDYGTQNAFAALLWAYDGRVWHCVDEYRHSGRETGRQKTDGDYLEDMRRFTARIPDGEEFPFVVDPSAASFIALLRRGGFKVRRARNDVLDGIRETAACMQVGAVRVSDGCGEVRTEFAGYSWKDGEDAPVKENDHMMDALRYFVATMRLARAQEEEHESPFVRRA